MARKNRSNKPQTTEKSKPFQAPSPVSAPLASAKQVPPENKHWTILLDASVYDSLCWEITYFIRSDDHYSLHIGHTTYGGWGNGPFIDLQEKTVDPANPAPSLPHYDKIVSVLRDEQKDLANKMKMSLLKKKYHVMDGARYDFGALDRLMLPKEYIRVLKSFDGPR